MSKAVNKDIRYRVYLTFSGICLFGLIIISKAAWIQIKEGKSLHDKAVELNTRYKYDTIAPERGNIYTEDGTLLCSSVPEFECGIDFTVINPDTFKYKLDSLCFSLSTLFGKPANEYQEEFEHAFNKKLRYYPLASKLTFSQYDTLRRFPIFRMGKNVGGLIVHRTEKRDPPYKGLAFRTLGIYKPDTNSSGLEGFYDEDLTGEYGTCESQKSAAGWIPVEGTEVEPENGKDLVTTIDIGIQEVAEKALMGALQDKKGDWGTCIVMETATGKIRALANLGLQSQDGKYVENLNYALTPTEPGSTFKMMTLLSLLNDKLINVDDKVDPQHGLVYFGPDKMEDTHPVDTPLPIWQAYALSSNCAMALLANKHYKNNPSRFVKHLTDMMLDTVTFIDLPGEKKGRINKKTNKWGASTLPWMATGYGIAITPMQTCMMYNAVANNGKMMKPYLVSSIKEYGKEVKNIEPTVLIEHVGDSSTITQLKKCMRAVLTDGTAKSIESPFYSIAGKTGTAKVADGPIKYSDKVYQGSFVGFIPAESPKYTICVVVRTQKGATAHYGIDLAAPVFKKVADKIFNANIGSWAAPLDSMARNGSGRFNSLYATAENYRILLSGVGRNVPIPQDPNDSLMNLHQDSTRRISIKPSGISKYIVPDVKGMALKDAIFILETSGLRVRIIGRGKVQNQSMEPGTKVIKGQNITISLS